MSVMPARRERWTWTDADEAKLFELLAVQDAKVKELELVVRSTAAQARPQEVDGEISQWRVLNATTFVGHRALVCGEGYPFKGLAVLDHGVWLAIRSLWSRAIAVKELR
eukprot:4619672-Amphidinium_carterae.1